MDDEDLLRTTENPVYRQEDSIEMEASSIKRDEE